MGTPARRRARSHTHRRPSPRAALSRRARAAQRRAARLRRTLLSLVLFGLLGIGLWAWQVRDSDEVSARPPVISEQPPAPPTEPEPTTGEDEEPATDEESASVEEELIPVPTSGPGTFQPATSSLDTVGGTDRYAYEVLVEDNIELDPTEVGAEVHAILGHQQGWTNDGETGFQLSDTGGVDFSVKIATPDTVDALCGEYGLDTQGEVNCRVGDEVIVNLLRWVEGSPKFPGPIEEYRALIINHEVGHRLGYGHEGCPGPGELAPAMMQQIRGLDGCEANAWPYDQDGDYIEGPWEP